MSQVPPSERAISTRPGQRGQGLAEFALALPIFLVILLGLFDIGRAVFAYNTLTNAVREGARLGIVNQTDASIDQRVHGQATGIDPTACILYLQPGVNWDSCGPSLNPPAAWQCAPGSRGIGCIVFVQGTAQFNPITPVISTLVGTISMTAKSQIPIEFECPNATVSAASCPKQP